MTLTLAASGVLLAAPFPSGPRAPQPPKPPPSADAPYGEDLAPGKTPAQSFASDCSVCHKTSKGLAKDKNVSSLTSFLRQHYTTGTPQAAALANFLTSGAAAVGEPEPRGGLQPRAPITTAPETARTTPPERAPAGTGTRPAKPEEAAKPAGEEGAGARRARRTPAGEQTPSQTEDGAPRPPGDIEQASPEGETEKPAEPAATRRPPKSEEANKPADVKPAPAARERRVPKPQQAAQPAEKPATPGFQPEAGKKPEPATSAASPPAEEKPAAPAAPAPEIPL